jgi:hypothetical protein
VKITQISTQIAGSRFLRTALARSDSRLQIFKERAFERRTFGILPRYGRKAKSMFCVQARFGEIHLVTHDLDTGAFEVPTLDHWIRKDLNLYIRAKERRPKSNWVILAAVASLDEAKEHIAGLGCPERFVTKVLALFLIAKGYVNFAP